MARGWPQPGRALSRRATRGLPATTPTWTTTASSFASAGDVDGDGFGDIIVGDPGFVFDGQVVGRAVVYFGGDGGVDEARPPWVVLGEQPDERLGAAVGAAGDVDGDGFGDVIIGSPGYDHGRGRARIFRGERDRPVAGAAWIHLGDAVGAAFGTAVGTVWDVDADGRSDTFVGAAGGAGLAAVVYLFRADTPAWSVSAGRITGVGDSDGDGFADLIAATSEYAAIHFGARDFGARVPRVLADACPLGPAGDVNGDGYADVVGGAIYFGTPVGPGATAAATRALEGCGTGVGDVDGDGFGDVMVGAEVVHGAWSGLAAEAEWRFDDVYRAVAAQDVDGDGFDDLLLAAPGFSSDGLTQRGRAQLYQGSAQGPALPPSWTRLGDAAYEWFGECVAGAGDVDGDGYPDVVVGSPGANPERDATGGAQVFWGSRAGIASDRAPSVVLPHLSERRLGSACEGVGDLDGDGLAEIVVGIAPIFNVFSGTLDVYRGESGALASGRSWRLSGSASEAALHYYRARALGDVDGDGLGDFGIYTNHRVTEAFFGAPLDLVVQRGATWGDALEHDYNEVAGAGDFDGDGRGDLLFASPSYAGGDGLVEVRRVDMSTLRSLRGEPGSELGVGIAGAGDVDGDGFADVLVSAPRANGDFAQAGRVSIWFGPDATRTWSFAGRGADALLGESVGTPGDLDGDGFPEILVRSRESRTTVAGDHVRVFRGNGGLGFGAAFPFRIRARRPGTGVAIPAWGTSDSVSGFDLTSEGRSPHGAGRVMLEAEVKPSATPFDGRARANVRSSRGRMCGRPSWCCGCEGSLRTAPIAGALGCASMGRRRRSKAGRGGSTAACRGSRRVFMCARPRITRRPCATNVTTSARTPAGLASRRRDCWPTTSTAMGTPSARVRSPTRATVA